MLSNYIKISIRNFLKDRGYSFINVLGLAVGMTCALLIGLYIWDELRFDNYHSKRDRLYRVALHRTFPANETYWATSPPPMAEALRREYPEVVGSTRIFQPFNDVRVRRNDDIYFESGTLAADSNFFDVFSIKLIRGNPKNVLSHKNGVVLTESTARKYFGEEDPIDKQLLMFSDTSVYMVTGVTEDVPANTHFSYDILLPFIAFPLSESNSWAGYNVHTYVVLDDAKSADALQAKFPKLVEKAFGPEVENILGKKYSEYVAAGNHHNYHLQKVEDIHLHSNYQQELQPNGDIRYVYLFGAICFFILFVAGVNFTNLSTARSFRRSKEIGIRKVHGSVRRQLIGQFLTESLFVTFLSLVIAIVFVFLVLDWFNEFAAKGIRLKDLSIIWTSLTLLGLLLINGLLAGVYPAFIVSALEPVKILKGKFQANKSTSVLRNALVIIQFGVSVVLIVSTMVIFRQLNYMRGQKLGFDKEHILVLERANTLGAQRNAFNEELRSLPGISVVSASFTVPGRQFQGGTFSPVGAETTERINYASTFCDYYFPAALGVELAAGRLFSRDIAGDSLAVVINESLVKRVGWKNADEAVGQKIRPVFNMRAEYEIIGVTRDFNFQSLHTAIQPLAFFGSDPETLNSNLAVIRFQSGTDPQSVLRSIEEVWDRFIPSESMEYTFLDEEFGELYRQEERFGKIFTLFSCLAIFIAVIGVIGLSTFMASQRTKEIAIRKIVGASVPTLLSLLSKEFLRLIVIANLIFWPLTWFGLSRWLSNYPFHTNLSWLLFVFTGLITTAIVLLSISIQSLKAATANPVTALRND
jgi:putative ABC transport system permease protein